jgi:hypothetical protein
MRKHPLIALTAFTALTASAIAGASTGSLNTNTILTSARTTHPSSQTAARDDAKVVFLDAHHSVRASLSSDGLVLGPDRIHPGLRLAHKPRLRHTAPVVEAVDETPVIQAAPPPPPATVVTTTTVSAGAPAGGVWYELRMCESGDNYAEDSGNGYYGAYQFALSTWYGLGFTGVPSEASPAVQDEAAAELQATSGWDQWPSCAAELGL